MQETSGLGSLSDRIDRLLVDADHLRARIVILLQEVNEREGIEAVEGLADVPDDLEYAEGLMRSVCAELRLARQDAINGGD